MANIMDYLEWRGDVPFTAVGLNEVDNLIFSFLSYVEFDDIVPGLRSDQSITLEEASRVFWDKYTEDEVKERNINTWESTVCMKKMAECERFRKVRLSHYINRIDPEAVKQFSAVTIEYAPNQYYIAFRGTDSTIVGWKEDFYLSFQTVAAEKDAEDYLNYVGSMLPGRIDVGGHSKGGNLAVYASRKANRQIQDKIHQIYSNDGPGFRKDITETQGYLRIKEKIVSFVPETSIVGMLLYHEEDYLVVKSSASGFRQHLCMTWQVMGQHFVYTKTVSEESRMYDQALSGWIDSMDEEERREFVEALFGALEKAGIRNLSDLIEGNKGEKVKEILTEMKRDEEGYQMIKNAGKMLFEETAKSLSGMFRTSFEHWISKYKRAIEKKEEHTDDLY